MSLPPSPGGAVTRDPPGPSSADVLRCPLCGQVGSPTEGEGPDSATSGRDKCSVSALSSSCWGLGARAELAGWLFSLVRDGAPWAAGLHPTSRYAQHGQPGVQLYQGKAWAHPLFSARSSRVVRLCPSDVLFPGRGRKGQPKEKCTFNVQPQAEEPAGGVTAPTAPWTVVSGCCASSASPSCFCLRLLSSRRALPASLCVRPFRSTSPSLSVGTA